ncbi:MAG: hypothetical protein FJ215_06465 [Ignavibacteria bacterium]|nr:hypothetical protein [Ignavibacteria bacterium]
MADMNKRLWTAAKFGVSIMTAVLALQLFMACDSDDSNPARSPECGSGAVDWDAKAEVCRDRSNGIVVPSSCCGR